MTPTPNPKDEPTPYDWLTDNAWRTAAHFGDNAAAQAIHYLSASVMQVARELYLIRKEARDREIARWGNATSEVEWLKSEMERESNP